MAHYYNEIEPYAAQWLRNLIAARLIGDGVVDERSIVDVQPDDLKEFTQCHFFAGIAGWSLAARLAGWPDDRELWTGSTPCQPFSVAGKQAGTSDERHLWPHYFRLVSARRPAVVMGEQVAAAVGKNWLDGVLSDLEGIGYSGRACVVPACAVDGPHRRDRLWFVADRAQLLGDGGGYHACGGAESAHTPTEFRIGHRSDMDHSERARLEGLGGHGDGTTGRAEPDRSTAEAGSGSASAWHDHGWIIGHDGKARRVKSGIRLLAHGVPARVGKLRAYGNAIVAQVAAEVIAAYMECRP